MTEAEKFASPEKIESHINKTSLFHVFLIPVIGLCLWYIDLPALDRSFVFLSLSFFIIFATSADHIVVRYDILGQVSSQVSSKFVREFISISIVTSCIFWGGVVGSLVGSLFTFALYYMYYM